MKNTNTQSNETKIVLEVRQQKMDISTNILEINFQNSKSFYCFFFQIVPTTHSHAALYMR